MKSETQSKNWLPRLNRELAVRVNGLLKGTDTQFADQAESETLVQYALQDALDRKGTDIHLEPFSAGWRIRFRIDGNLYDVAQTTPEQGQRAIRYLKTLSGLDSVTAFLLRTRALESTFLERRSTSAFPLPQRMAERFLLYESSTRIEFGIE